MKLHEPLLIVLGDLPVHSCFSEAEVPWDSVERNLTAWLKALRAATCSGNARQVLRLLEGLVSFVCCNDGSFLRTIVSGESMAHGLRARGAPDSLIATFLEVIQCTGGMEGAILSFGSATSMPPDLAAEIIMRMQQAQRARSPSSPDARSGSPQRPSYLPQRTTQDMLDQLWHDAGSSGAAAGGEFPDSLRISRLANAVVAPVESLSPDVISGLECADAVPFLILRWLNACLVEAIFCIHHADTTFVLKRTVLYVGPKPGTQLEGQAAIDWHEKLQLEGNSYCLPWTDVAGLLAAPPEVSQ